MSAVSTLAAVAEIAAIAAAAVAAVVWSGDKSVRPIFPVNNAGRPWPGTIC